MANRTIEIIVDVRDQTGGKLGGLKKQLDAMDKAAQRMSNRLKALSMQKYAATLRFIDQVTAPASRINNLLKKIAGGVYKVTMKVNDAALGGIRKIESALQRISGKVYNVAVNVKGGAMNKLNGLMSGAAMGAGMFMPIAGMAGVGFGVANAIQASAGFEKQMSQVQAIRQLSKDSQEMKALTQQAKDLGMTTAWTRQQVGEAMYYQALAGWDTQQILKSTPHLLNLASAGGTDLGRTSDIVTDSMTAFGLRATEDYVNKQGKTVNAVEHFADMLAKLQASSNTDISQAGEAFKYSANVIGAMFSGQDISQRMQATEDAMIMTGLMANAGIKGSMAGTATRAIFARMASGNRNAFWPLQGMGIKYEDDDGNLLLPGEIMRNISRKFKEGIDPNQLLEFAESIAGEKIHADTRRKLDSFIEQTMRNGGKMGSADMAKMAAMLAGQEAMSGLLAVLMGDWDAMAEKLDNVGGTAKEMSETMLDNLAGSFTMLGSAWDAFQQDLFTGTAGDSLRGLVDTMTEILTRANKLFKDGIDIGDFGQIIADVVDKLKNKFLQLDGVGSLLAGGALVAGLTKIISLSQRAFTALKTITQPGAWSTVGKTGTGGAGMAAGAKVGTMTVSAGVVNINGRMGGAGGYYGGGGRGGVPGMGVAAPTTAAAVFAAQKQFDKLNSQFIAAQAKRDAKWGRVENLFAMGAGDKQLARARTLARNFDEKTFLPLQTRFNAAQQALINARVADYNAQIAQSKQSIALAREQEKLMSTSRWSNFKGAAGGAAVFAGIFSALDMMNVRAANAERLAAATTAEERTLIARENRHAEWQAAGGGLGSVVGAAIGAGLGSFAGPLGTAIGGVVGGMLGDAVGRWFGEKGAERETVKSGTNLDVLDKEIQAHMTPATPPDYSFGQTQTNKTLESFATFDKEAMAWSGATTVAVAKATQEVHNMEQQLTNDTETWVADFKRQSAMARDFTGQWRENSTAFDYYQQRAADMAANPNQFQWQPFAYMQQAHAAELTPEQMAQQAAMEQGTFYPTGEMTTPGEPPEVPDMSAFVEQFYSEIEALQEGVGELFSGFGEQITEQLTSAFEGAGEVFANFGTTITEGLTTTFEGAGEMFTGFGEQLTASMTTAQESATTALTAIQTSFTTTKDTVQTSWAELPGFFAGVFSGLGGAAEAAGAAIHAGLTAPIGSIISAWQGAAATISSIISSISAQAAAMPSVPSGGSVPAHAEGGFITSPEVALIGEKGAEAIIPLDGSKRAFDLYRKTGEVLGVSEEFGDSTISGTSNGNSNSGGITINVGGISFEVHANNLQELENSASEKFQELADKLAAHLSEKVSTVFKNQTLVA